MSDPSADGTSAADGMDVTPDTWPLQLTKHVEKKALFDDLTQGADNQTFICVVIKAFASLLGKIDLEYGDAVTEISVLHDQETRELRMTSNECEGKVLFEFSGKRTTLTFHVAPIDAPPMLAFQDVYHILGEEFVSYPTSAIYWHKKGVETPKVAFDVSADDKTGGRLEILYEAVARYRVLQEFCVSHECPALLVGSPKKVGTVQDVLARFVGKHATLAGTENDFCISVVDRREHEQGVICLNGISYDSVKSVSLSNLTRDATLYDFSYKNGELIAFGDIERLIKEHQALFYRHLVENPINNLPYLKLLDEDHKSMAAAEIRKPAYSSSSSSKEVAEFLEQYPARPALKRKRSGEDDANDQEPKAVAAFCKLVRESGFFVAKNPLGEVVPFRLHVLESGKPSATAPESGRVDCYISRQNLKKNDPEERYLRRAALDTLTKHVSVERAPGVLHAVKPSARRCASELLSTMLFVEFCGKAKEPLETIWKRLFKDAEQTLDPGRSEDCLSQPPESMDTTPDGAEGPSSPAIAEKPQPPPRKNKTQEETTEQAAKGKKKKRNETAAQSPLASPPPTPRDDDDASAPWKTAQKKKLEAGHGTVVGSSLPALLAGFVFGGNQYVSGARAQTFAGLYVTTREKKFHEGVREKLDKPSEAGLVDVLRELQTKRLDAINNGKSKKDILGKLQQLYSEEAVLLSNALLAVMGGTSEPSPTADGLEGILPCVLAYWRGLFTDNDPCMTLAEKNILPKYLENLKKPLSSLPAVSATNQKETLLFLADFIRAALPIHCADDALKQAGKMRVKIPAKSQNSSEGGTMMAAETDDEFADRCDRFFTKWFDDLYGKTKLWYSLSWFYEDFNRVTEVDGAPAFATMTPLINNIEDILPPYGDPIQTNPFVHVHSRRGFRVAQMMMGGELRATLDKSDSIEGRFYRLADDLSVQLEGRPAGPPDGVLFPFGPGEKEAERAAWKKVYTDRDEGVAVATSALLRFWQRLATVKSWHAAVMEIYVMFICHMVAKLDEGLSQSDVQAKTLRIHCISALFYIIMLRRLGESNGGNDILGGKYLLSETWKPQRTDPRVALLCKDADTTPNDPVFKLLTEYIGIGEDEIKEAVDFFGAPKTLKRKGAEPEPEPEPGSAASALTDVPPETSAAGQNNQPVVGMEYGGRSPGQAATKVSSEQDDVLAHGLCPFVIHFLFGCVHSALDRVAAEMLSRAAFAHEVAMLSTTSQSRAVASAACFLPMEEEGGGFSPALKRSSPREHAIAPPTAEALFARMHARTPAENALWIARCAVRFHDQRASEDDLVSYTESCTSLSVRIAAALLRMRALFTGITFTPTDPVSAVNLAKAVKRITTTDFTAAQRTSLDTILSGVSLILVAWWRTLRTFDLDDDIVRLAETLSRVTGDLAGSDMFENITADEYFSGSYCPKFHPISSPVVAMLGAGQGFLIPPRKSREEGKSPPSSTQKWGAIDIRQYWRKKRTERDKIVF